MLWFMFLLVGCILVGIAVWDYRRKARRREEATRNRFEQMFDLKAAAALHPMLPATAAATATPAPAAAPAISAAARVLSPPETLVFFLLKAGMPDHEIFPKAALGALVQSRGTGYGAEQQARKLAHHHVDFVVCDKGMHVTAVVELAERAGAEAAEASEARRFTAECLSRAGIRLVRIDTGALPPRHQIRKVILG